MIYPLATVAVACAATVGLPPLNDNDGAVVYSPPPPLMIETEATDVKKLAVIAALAGSQQAGLTTNVIPSADILCTMQFGGMIAPGEVLAKYIPICKLVVLPTVIVV